MKISQPNIARTPRRPRPFGPSLQRHGFTLLELVLVMVVLCTIVGMVAPTFFKFAMGRQVDDGAQHFVAIARYARNEAVARGRVIRLNIDIPNRTYWLTVQNGATYDRLGEEFGRDFSFPDQVSIDCDAPQQPDGRYIEFQPTGRSDPANIKFTQQGNGNVIQAGSPSTTDNFQIYPPEQQVQWGAWVTQKTQQAQADQAVAGSNTQ